ncbi:unnamed protein product, partial [Prunus brigantina]
MRAVVASLMQPHVQDDTLGSELSGFGVCLDSPYITGIDSFPQTLYDVFNGISINPCGSVRGLCLWWRINCSVEIFSTSKNLIKVRVFDDVVGTKELETIQSQSPLCVETEKTICDHLSEAWKNEEAYWKQRLRINWLKGGDATSKFFHLSTTQRRRRNIVSKLEDDNGVTVENEDDIRNLYESYYLELFTSSGPKSWGNS